MSFSAIHQPNFLPWMGYFSKIAKTDTFIFFDSVAISNGKTWTSRSQILVNGQTKWLTLPVLRKGLSGQRICDVELVNFGQNWRKILTTLRHAYGKTAYFEVIFPFLTQFEKENFQYLADFNCQFIQSVSRELGLTTQFIRSSSKPELMESSDLKTNYIVQTCLAFEIKNYVSGRGGSLAFLEQGKFADAGIKINFQGFSQKKHRQPNTTEFIGGLSIIDALMNCGWQATREYLQGE
ncbi:MAG: WbqC family protein [Saprospiraceae bacterium]|nr:WbqC family protein [Saprospiraceae bacterium]